MQEGYLVDVIRKRSKGEVFFNLHLKNKDGIQITRDADYESSFWADKKSHDVEKTIEESEDFTLDDVFLEQRGLQTKVTIKNPFHKKKLIDEFKREKIWLFGEDKTFSRDYINKKNFSYYDYLTREDGLKVDRKKPAFEPRLLAWDIETDNYDGERRIFFIPYGETETIFQSFSIERDEGYLSRVISHSKDTELSDEFELEIHSNEREMHQNFESELNLWDWDWLLTYNGYNYDLPVTLERMKSFNLESEFPFKRKKGGIEMKRRFGGFVYNLEGKQILDLFLLMKKLYRLNSYRLKPIAKYFLNEKPLDLGADTHSYWVGDSEKRRKMAEYNASDTELLLKIFNYLELSDVLVNYSNKFRLSPMEITNMQNSKICLHLLQQRSDKHIYNERNLGDKKFKKIRDSYACPFYKKGRHQAYMYDLGLLKTSLLANELESELIRDDRKEVADLANSFLGEISRLNKAGEDSQNNDTSQRLISKIASELPALLIDENFYSNNPKYGKLFTKKLDEIMEEFREHILFADWRNVLITFEKSGEFISKLKGRGITAYREHTEKPLEVLVADKRTFVLWEPVSDTYLSKGVTISDRNAPDKINHITEKAVRKAILRNKEEMLDFLSSEVNKLGKSGLRKEEFLYQGRINQPIKWYKSELPHVQVARKIEAQPGGTFWYGIKFRGEQRVGIPEDEYEFNTEDIKSELYRRLEPVAKSRNCLPELKSLLFENQRQTDLFSFA